MEKTKNKGYKMFYDLKTLPVSFKLKQVVDIMKKENVIIFDTSHGGEKPMFIHLGGDKNKKFLDTKFIDLSKYL